MVLWIAVTLPLLPLEAVRPPVPAGCAPSSRSEADAAAPRCYALADRQRIVMPDLDALREGVRAGHARSHALALAPGLALLAPDAAREAQAFDALALALLAYTPKLARAASHTLLLEVGAGLRLFGGLRALLAKVAATAAACGHVARIACAPTAWGAWLLAQARAQRAGRRWRVAREATLARTLDALPVSLAPLDARHGHALAQIGCATLADLRRLPRAGLARRFGDGVLGWLAQAYGSAPDPREWFSAPPSFAAALELHARVDSADALLFAARRLVLQLAGWLAARQLALRAFELRLEHDVPASRVRAQSRTSSVRIGWAAPSRDADHLLWLLREKLNQTQLAAPVLGLALVAADVCAYAAPTDSWLPSPERVDATLAQFFERIGARLGADNVRQMTVVPDHRPERAMRIDAYRGPSPSDARGTGKRSALRADANAASVGTRRSGQVPAAQTSAETGAARPLPAPPRPVWLLEEPQRLAMREQRPVYGRPLVMVTRAERIESGWWDGAGVARDYHVAADGEGRLFWVYREHPGGAWFLHGCFG